MKKDEIINSSNRVLKAELSVVEIYSAHAEAIREDEIAHG